MEKDYDNDADVWENKYRVDTHDKERYNEILIERIRRLEASVQSMKHANKTKIDNMQRRHAEHEQIVRRLR